MVTTLGILDSIGPVLMKGPSPRSLHEYQTSGRGSGPWRSLGQTFSLCRRMVFTGFRWYGPFSALIPATSHRMDCLLRLNSSRPPFAPVGSEDGPKMPCRKRKRTSSSSPSKTPVTFHATSKPRQRLDFGMLVGATARFPHIQRFGWWYTVCLAG
ncbi:hypothetical protein FB45DRAFT_945676 [Roridomyces roridus]|uniref:Uncharacterized protein n=1 Tax=Roridomyces roridus TaxID=1738132 RepID=A0AAD7B379_9AGAR|nr:hypothetical protein FB45DRAFT_945676 [Roridomyces roridus]